MKIKVSELSGAALDWVVAQTCKTPVWIADSWLVNGIEVPTLKVRENEYWSPSTNWSQAGKFIHDHQIEFLAQEDDNHAMHASLSAWRRHGLSHRTRWVSGETHLIAACRSIVFTFFGETVEVPQELAP